MADKQITELPAVEMATDDIILPIYVPGDASAHKLTVGQLKQHILDALSGTSS